MALRSSSSLTQRWRCVWAALFLNDLSPLRTEVQLKERREAMKSIYLNYFYQIEPFILIIRKMDKSNSNSQQSNLFIISSESSRSDNKQHRKDNYVKFAKKVKELLDVPGNDLDQLYQKLESIVIKYFKDHSVVDFQEMYAHIVALKSNSSKMTEMVALLEKRLCRSSSKHEEGRKSSKTDEFQTTINSHKQTRNSLHRQASSNNNKQELLNIFSDSYGQVNSSIKYNHVFKPSFVQENNNQMTPKANRTKNEKESSSLKYSPSKASPSKSNFSEEYYNRNKEYETRVKQMMKQLQTIKQNINVSKRSQPQTQNLRINLRQNQQKSVQKGSNTQLQQTKQVHNENQIPKKPTQSEIKAYQQNKSTSNSYIHQLINFPSKEKDFESNRAEAKVEIFKKQEPESAKEKQKKITFDSILKSTQNISKQIEQLKEVASRLQIDSVQDQHQNKKGSDTSIYPSDRINELIKKVSEEKSKKQPILEQIENTTSQMKISENMIPSFKNLPQKDGNTTVQRQIFTTELNVGSFKQPVNVSYNDVNTGQQNFLSSSQVVNSFRPLPEQQPPYNLSTIKYVYNPYPNPVIYPNRSLYIKPEAPRAAQLFQPAPSPVQKVYVPQMSSPINSSNNSSTSIMHPHLFARQRENVSQAKPQPEIQRSFVSPAQKGQINTIYSYPSSSKSIGSNQSNQSSLNSQSSTNSLHRKGLNVITHIQKRP